MASFVCIKNGKICSAAVGDALALVWDVFLEFKAPDCQEKGVEAFRTEVVRNDDFISDRKRSICPIYAAFDGKKMIGIIGMRSDKKHINLLFVRKEYHRRKAATLLFRRLLAEVTMENPLLKEITLNSSSYVEPFHLHIGFEASDGEQEKSIRFLPMKYKI